MCDAGGVAVVAIWLRGVSKSRWRETFTRLWPGLLACLLKRDKQVAYDPSMPECSSGHLSDAAAGTHHRRGTRD